MLYNQQRQALQLIRKFLKLINKLVYCFLVKEEKSKKFF